MFTIFTSVKLNELKPVLHDLLIELPARLDDLEHHVATVSL